MSISTSMIFFCIFIAVFLGLIISNIILVKQTFRRVLVFLTSVVLPLILFLIYYSYEAPKIKATKEIPEDIGRILLKMDLVTFYLVLVFIIQVAIMVYLIAKKQGKKEKN